MPHWRNNNMGSAIAHRQGLVRAASPAGTRFGPAIDRFGFDSAAISYAVDAVTGAPTGQTITLSLQDSPDSTPANFVDVPLAGSGVKTTATPEVVGVNCDLCQLRRFVRVKEVATFVGGTAPTVDANAHLILGGSRTLPV